MSLFDRPEYSDGTRVGLLARVPVTAQKILDIGCNRGAFGRSIKAKRKVEVWGVEPDRASAECAGECLDQVIIDYFHERNPIPDAYFDLITFNDSLEHMPDPAYALVLSKRKLIQGGRIHCCVPNMRQIDNLEHLLFEKDWRYEAQGIRDRTHLRFFTEKSIVRLFEDTGFKVLEVTGINEQWWASDKFWRRVFFVCFRNLLVTCVPSKYS